MENPHIPPPADTAMLTQENQKLRARLQDLLRQASDNQKILQRQHELNLKLIAADGFIELISVIFRSMPAISSLEVVTLLVLDHQKEVRSLMTNLQIDLSDYPNLLIRHEQLNHELIFLQRPEVGPFKSSRHDILFPDILPTPVSVAVIPLHRHHKLIGFLNLGSLQPDRFTSGMATDFIEFQASIIAVCLENAINHERLKHISLTDSLTGVSNRRYVEKRMLEEVSLALRHGTALSCLFIDIDYFKRINDRLGHAIGDDVLCAVTSRIKAELRISDVLGRFGGEEFVVILPNIKSVDAIVAGERIRTAIGEKPLRTNGGVECTITVSIGVSTLHDSARKQPPEQLVMNLLALADSALYQAKEKGRNQVIFSST